MYLLRLLVHAIYNIDNWILSIHRKDIISLTITVTSVKKMKSVQLVVVTAFTFSLMGMGTSQCDGEKC